MDLRDNPQGPLIIAIQGYIEPIYRYHLSRSEDYFEAQTLTIYTLRGAVKWLEVHKPVSQSDLNIRILEIASFQQAFGRRHSIPVGFKAKRAPNNDLDEEDDSTVGSYHQSNQDDNFGIDLAEISLHNQISQLSRSWKQLPRQQADALALYYFAGLTLADVGKVLKKSDSDIKRLITSQAVFETEIISLAGSSHPDWKFVELLQADLRNISAQRPSALWEKIDLTASQSYAVLRKIGRSGLRLVQLGSLVGILALGLVVILNQSATGSPEITPTPAAVTSLPILNSTIDYRGNLVPPAMAVCQQWQAALAKTTGLDMTFTWSAFSDPVEAGPNANGTGCLLEATVSQGDNRGAWPVFNSVSQLLTSNFFIQQNALSRYYSLSGPNYYGLGCVEMGKTLANNNVRAILSITWCPPDTTSKNPAPAAPSSNGQKSANIGWMARNLSPFTIKVFLASNTVEPVLDNIFNDWSNGSVQVISYFSPALLKRFPTLAALDNMAGIDRLNAAKIIFVWNVIDNSGTALRLDVIASDVTSDGTIKAVLNQFQVSLVLDNGTWVVQGMGQKVPFS